MANKGSGATLTFGSWSADIESVNPTGITRAVIPTPHHGLGPGAAIPKLLADHVDYGGVDVEFHYDHDNVPPIDGTEDTLLITYPLPTGETSGTAATMTGQAALTNVSSTIPLEDVQMGTVTFTWLAKPTQTSFAP